MVLLEGEPYEGVEPNLHGGGGAVIVLLKDEHLRFDEGHQVDGEPPKEGEEVSS